MKKYLTRGEFARMRSLNINSIRYYENQGILSPAWVDPQTKYHYYLPEQLPILDMIMLCIRLGLPLQEAKRYIDLSGQVDSRALLEYGRQLMQERIAAMQVEMETAEHDLRNIALHEQYRGWEGIYIREIEERYFLEKSFTGNWDDLIQKDQMASALFIEAQEKNLAPVFPASILVRYNKKSAAFSFLTQILRPPEDRTDIFYVPAASFSCVQAELVPQSDILAILQKHFPASGTKTAIITDMRLSEIQFGVWHTEIQILKIERPAGD